MQELNENSFLARSTRVSVLSSSLLFAVEFIIICSTVVSRGQHGAVLGARQTPNATRLPEAERGAGAGTWPQLENRHRNTHFE